MKAILFAALLCADPETAALPPLFLIDGLPSHTVCARAAALAHSESCRLKEFSEELWRWRKYPGYETWSWTVWAQHQAQQERAAIWCDAERATNRCLPEVGRRQALDRLTHWPGWAAVIRGQLPPPIPLE